MSETASTVKRVTRSEKLWEWEAIDVRRLTASGKAIYTIDRLVALENDKREADY
jgi:hypothetical protein